MLNFTNKLLKWTVPCLHVLVLLENIQLSWDATSLWAISDMIDYQNIDISGLLVKLLLHVGHIYNHSF